MTYILGDAEQALSFTNWSDIVDSTASSYNCGDYQTSYMVLFNGANLVGFTSYQDTHFINKAYLTKELVKVSTTDTAQIGTYTF